MSVTCEIEDARSMTAVLNGSPKLVRGLTRASSPLSEEGMLRCLGAVH